MRTSVRTTARLWLFIGTFVFSIPGYLLYGPLLDHPKYVLGGVYDTQITVGALLGILTAICNVGTAIALYPLAMRYAPGPRSATSRCASSSRPRRHRQHALGHHRAPAVQRR